MNRASDVPPPVSSFGSTPVASMIARRSVSTCAPGSVRNDSPLIAMSRSKRSACCAITARSQADSARPGVVAVEPDVQHRAGRGRDHVGHRVADVDAGELEAGRLEPVVAGVERRRGQRSGDADQPVHRIVGALRIGDVALRAVHRDLRVQAAAAADLHHVAERHRAGRFADDAEVGDLTVGLHPLQHAHGAVDRHAFLVAGDQQADRAARRAVTKVLRRRGDERRDAALHVTGAAAVQDAVAHLAGERTGLPVRGANRHDVGVTGKADVRRAGADAGEQVVDLAVAQRCDGEAEVASEHRPARSARRHRRA